MKINTQIKKYRIEMNLSQSELAEKVFVTRQTISNWETAKSYPDIHSLLLLSSLFNISLDQLIKGDIEDMKEIIKKEEIQKLNHYGNIFTILMIITLVSAVPIFMLLGVWANIPWGILAIITFKYALKVEEIKKTNNVQTIKEIIAFTEGKRLDEIQQAQEVAKRPYQTILAVIISAIIGYAVCSIIKLIIHIICLILK